MAKYDITVKLIGNDGNAFSVVATVLNGLRKNGVPKNERDLYIKDALAGDYDHLLRVTMDWVEVQ